MTAPTAGAATAGHTPGPWHHVEWDCDPRVNDDGNHYWGIKPLKFHGGAEYLEASGWMTEANARLLAAAPELLSALQGLRGWMPPAGDEAIDAAMRNADAAILKATGGEA